MTVQADTTRPHDPVISFLDDDYDDMILIKQGNSANVLYCTTFQKLGLPKLSLEECSSTLINFVEKKYPVVDWVGTVRAYQRVTHQCYGDSLKDRCRGKDR
ncbi:hypothetical protein CR513_49753, partial [Mucuna pruriens]